MKHPFLTKEPGLLMLLPTDDRKMTHHRNGKATASKIAQNLNEDTLPYRCNEPQRRQLYCVDLFAGCGGLSLGLEHAGFQPLLFSEINSSAAETYIANRPELDLAPIGDIYQLTNTNLELFKIYWRHKGIEDIDLVCGGPPCQGYSGIGHRRTFNL